MAIYLDEIPGNVFLILHGVQRFVSVISFTPCHRLSIVPPLSPFPSDHTRDPSETHGKSLKISVGQSGFKFPTSLWVLSHTALLFHHPLIDQLILSENRWKPRLLSCVSLRNKVLVPTHKPHRQMATCPLVPNALMRVKANQGYILYLSLRLGSSKPNQAMK